MESGHAHGILRPAAIADYSFRPSTIEHDCFSILDFKPRSSEEACPGARVSEIGPMTWAAVLFWIIIVTGFLMRGPLLLLYAFFAFGAFGSLALIPPDAVGGLNLSAQSFGALFLVAKILLAKGNPGRAIQAALDPTWLGLLFLFLAYGIFSAYLMPQLFEHVVQVIPISVVGPAPIPLKPTAANLTQPAYMTLSVGATLAFALAGADANFRRHYLRAMLFAGIVLVVTGVADMVTSSLGVGDLLQPFRNVSELPSIDDYILDTKRVVGLMPEASSYGGTCVDAVVGLALLRPCFPRILRNWVVPATIVGLLVIAGLSTSSTAYVGLVVFAMTFAANWLRRSLDPRALNPSGLFTEAFVVTAAALIVLVVVMLEPTILDPVSSMIDTMVFHKVDSGSYVERTMWTRTGLDAFFATHGIGVGLGSERTSNWYVAILSNTGIVGATLLACFIVQVFLHRCRGDAAAVEFMAALKFSLLPAAVMIGLAGTTPDFGPGPGSKLGLILGLASIQRLPDRRLRQRQTPASLRVGNRISARKVPESSNA